MQFYSAEPATERGGRYTRRWHVLQKRTGRRQKLFLLVIAASLLLPALQLGSQAVAAASPGGSKLATFYLHDDGSGFGHPGKRYDWANTTAPYNPLNPNFISPLYQGIELNSSGIQQSFRWIAWPSVGSAVTLSGSVNVTLYMTQSNSSSGSTVSFDVQLQDASTPSLSSHTVIAQNNISGIHLAPSTRVTVSLLLTGSYLLPKGHLLILNITRTDSNAGTSVYVSFDYNSSPSCFSAMVTPRLSQVLVTLTPQQIFDGTTFTVLANATDSLGSQDISSAYATVTSTGGQVIVNQSPMQLYQRTQYEANFSYSGQLPYGSYTLNVSVLSTANLTGSYQFSYSLTSLTVNPSLSNFSVSIPAHVTAGKNFTALFTAYSDSGGVMSTFSGSADIFALYPNSSMVPARYLAVHQVNFTSGRASVSESIRASGNLTFGIANGTSTGSAQTVVGPAPVSLVKISPSVVSLFSGEQLQFTAYGYDLYGNINSSWTPYWSAISGKVTQGGLFTATRNGSCNVTATDNATGAFGMANVSVSPSSLFRLAISPANTTVQAGQTYFFTATGYDYYGNPVSLPYVVWETNAGTLYSNGSAAMLNATRSTMTGGWVEAFAGGISATSGFNVTPSASSPQLLLQIPVQRWPSGDSWSFNLTNYFSNPNDPADSTLEWFLAGGGSLLYSYGSGSTGNTQVVLLPYGSSFGKANLTLTVRNSLGYSVTENFQVDILPRPSWSGSLPLYMTVPANSYYSLNYTYFLNTAPFQGDAVSVTSSSPYVYSSGLSLTYYFPQSFVSHSIPVVITATNPYNISSSVVQVITVGTAAAPTVNTASAPPSSITIDRGDNVTLEYPLETYFLSQAGLTFAVSATGAVARIDQGNMLFIEAPSSSYASSGSLLILASTAAGEYAFLKIELNIVSAVKPPTVKQLPAVYVSYSKSGNANYAIPLLPFVTDSYVPLSQVSVVTGVTYITFSSGNFSLLFSLPAFNPSNGSGQGGYTGPYWYNTTILVIGGPLQYLNQVSVSVPLSVHVSSTPPPSPARGKQLPSFVTIPENSVYSALNLSRLITAPNGVKLSFSASQADNLSTVVATDGQVTITPQSYYSGNSTIEFIANSTDGFFEFSLLVMVYPVYIPPVINTPSSIALTSSSSVVNLSKYVSNPNGEPLIIEAFGKGVTVVGDQMLVILPAGVSKETVTLVFISPVGASTARQLTLSLVSQFPSLYVVLFYLLLAVMVAVGAMLIYQRLIPKPFQLNSVLLIHNDGRLIAHSHSKDYSGVDRDILVGMFTAIQDFVSTSFPEVGGERQTLNRIELGRFSIFVERGTSSFILSIYTGQQPRNWPQSVRLVLSRIERTYPLLAWDGKQQSVAGVTDLLDALFPSTAPKE